MRKMFKFFRKARGKILPVQGEVHTEVQAIADYETLKIDIKEKIDVWQKTVDDFKEKYANQLNRESSENAEIKSLRERIEAIQQEGLVAGKNAIKVFGENDVLRSQLALHSGDISDWVARDEYENVKRSLEKSRQGESAARERLDNFQKSWNEFLIRYPSAKLYADKTIIND